MTNPAQAATALALACSLLASGCYNTYVVPQEEFRKLQSTTALSEDGQLQEKYKDNTDEFGKLLNRSEVDIVVVQSAKSEQVGVGRDTRLYVRTDGGRRYQLTPFNFSMASSQLVASDRDTLLPLSTLKAYEVDLLSTGKTVLMIAVAVGGAAGFIGAIWASSETKSF
ncbi:MAG: hypothetical protein EXR77_13905 [Myxococcales bacterium]|nr:hypothetical protein [Myxococcales bacterium]